MGFKSVLQKVAPFLGGLVGGPVGASVGVLIGNLLGVDPSNEESLTTALKSATPDQIIAIRQIESAERMRMSQLLIEEMKVHSGDRENARTMQIQTKEWMPSILGLGLMLGYFGVIAILMLFPVQQDAKEVMYMLIGTLSSALASVVSFYLGSSSGSHKKDDMIYKSTPI